VLAHGQRDPVGIAAPITRPDRAPIANVLVSLPESRFDSIRQEVLGAAVLAHAAVIFVVGGGSGSDPAKGQEGGGGGGSAG
jgi:uncharacterized membrane protein